MNPLLKTSNTEVHHSDWRELCSHVYRMEKWPDCLITDAPYSEKTHSGHDSIGELGARTINYKAWDENEVFEFVRRWNPIIKGWFVSITDDTLAPVWSRALADVDRYVFSMIPFVAPGSRIRMQGDGPSSWTCWIIVARPKSKEFLSWGTLDGAYILPPGMGLKMPIVGGKPPWLMCRLVEHYSRPGDLIVDPCCGAGTTGIGAIRTGRRVILGDRNIDHVNIAVDWLKNPTIKAPGIIEEYKVTQTLFDLDRR